MPKKKAATPKKKIKPAAKRKDPKLTEQEVHELLEAEQREARNERVWRDMTADEPDPNDAISETADKLAEKPHDSQHQLRRWKYYSK
ncbi:MAG: hypothetical protein ABIJ96_03050 [Elusimicrobiota bacterium]